MKRRGRAPAPSGPNLKINQRDIFIIERVEMPPNPNWLFKVREGLSEEVTYEPRSEG